MFASDNAVDAALGAGVRPPHLEVALVDLDDGPGDAFERWVVDDVGRLLEHLRTTLGAPAAGSRSGTGRQVVAVVLARQTAPPREPAVEAAWQAVRGVVQSLTRELDARVVRVNAVLAPEAAALGEALAFLASERGGFVAGASLDLRPVR